MKFRPALALLSLAVALVVPGCRRTVAPAPPAARYQTLPPKADVPPHLEGTVHQLVDVGGTRPLIASGYGLVVNLENTGRDDGIPTAVRQRVLETAIARGVSGANTFGQLGEVSPAGVLADPRTAVVRVEAVVPPAAVPGDRADVIVTALPGNTTPSLARGFLWQTDLFQGPVGPQNPGEQVNRIGGARGELMVNAEFALLPPEEAKDDPAAVASLRRATIPDGAVVDLRRSFVLKLRQPSRRMARLVEARLNLRFGETGVAAAQDEAQILVVPPERGHYARVPWDHFLNVALNVYRRADEQFAVERAGRLAAAMTSGALDDEAMSVAAYALEGLGRPALPTVLTLVGDPNPSVDFHAARAAAHLGEPAAFDRLAAAAAESWNPYSVRAARELGRVADLGGESLLRRLRRLTDAGVAASPQVQIEAYEALAAAGDERLIVSTDVADRFRLHVLPGTGAPLVYARRAGTPTIAVIGGGADPDAGPRVAPDALLTVFGDRLTLVRRGAGEHVRLFQRAPAGGENAQDAFVRMESLPDLPEVVGRLGGGGTPGERRLRLNYGDVVRRRQRTRRPRPDRRRTRRRPDRPRRPAGLRPRRRRRRPHRPRPRSPPRRPTRLRGLTPPRRARAREGPDSGRNPEAPPPPHDPPGRRLPRRRPRRPPAAAPPHARRLQELRRPHPLRLRRPRRRRRRPQRLRQVQRRRRRQVGPGRAVRQEPPRRLDARRHLQRHRRRPPRRQRRGGHAPLRQPRRPRRHPPPAARPRTPSLSADSCSATGPRTTASTAATPRLRDVRDLFLDTGVGVGAYSVIEQGRVAQMLDAGPQDRRAIFEEAAGVSRFRQQRTEATRRLERTEQNLQTLADVAADVERRLRSVKQAAGKARSFQELSARFEDLRRRLALHEYGVLASRLAGQEQAVRDAAERAESAANEATERKRTLDCLRSERAGLEARHRAAEHRRIGLDGELANARQRTEHARQQSALLAKQAETVDADRAEADRQLAAVVEAAEADAATLESAGRAPRRGERGGRPVAGGACLDRPPPGRGRPRHRPGAVRRGEGDAAGRRRRAPPRRDRGRARDRRRPPAGRSPPAASRSRPRRRRSGGNATGSPPTPTVSPANATPAAPSWTAPAASPPRPTPPVPPPPSRWRRSGRNAAPSPAAAGCWPTSSPAARAWPTRSGGC